MPLKGYSVLKGRAIDNRLATGASPHYQILVAAAGGLHRVAVNVRSADGSEVEFLVRWHLEHPLTEGLAALAEGLHRLPSRPGGLALDFIRANIAQPWEFTPLPLSAAGPDNDLNEKLDAAVRRAMSDERAMLCAFGVRWGPEAEADRYFGFRPGRGVHDVHFNQGNPPGPYAADNGPWQDGGLILQFPDAAGGAGQWVGIFLKFRSQAWHSDDRTGDLVLPPDPGHPGRPHGPIARDRIPPLGVPDGLVRIVAACVNDRRTPERETVTLLNTADLPVDLTGWSIRDRQKNAMVLPGTVIAPGATLLVVMRPPVTLSNQGGLITLADARGIKVHGVSYTRAQAREPGRTIPFQD